MLLRRRSTFGGQRHNADSIWRPGDGESLASDSVKPSCLESAREILEHDGRVGERMKPRRGKGNKIPTLTGENRVNSCRRQIRDGSESASSALTGHRLDRFRDPRPFGILAGDDLPLLPLLPVHLDDFLGDYSRSVTLKSPLCYASRTPPQLPQSFK